MSEADQLFDAERELQMEHLAIDALKARRLARISLVISAAVVALNVAALFLPGSGNT